MYISVEKWMFLGVIPVILLSGLVLATATMKPWNPMPIYQVVMAWAISWGFMTVLPLIYVLEVFVISKFSVVGKPVLIATIALSLLNLMYFISSWRFGVQYQGGLHAVFGDNKPKVSQSDMSSAAIYI